MPKVSIGSWAFGIYSERPLPFGQVLDRVAALGFDGIELGAFDPHPDPLTCSTPSQRAELKQSFEQRGLEVSAVAADFGTEGFLKTADPSAYLGALDRNLEFCRALGAGRLIVNTVNSPQTPYDIGLAVARERLLSTWREAAGRASAVGVTLVWEFEPCWAFNEPDQIVELAHELAGPGFGVLYDTAHAHTVCAVGARQVNGPAPLAGGQVEMLGRLSGTIAHVHLLDSDGTLHDAEESTERTTVHMPFGTGRVKFDEVTAALVEAGGMTDWWTVDLCFWPDAWEATEASKEFVDALIATAASA
jgi:sugar phosphate isomerase/epimerase